MKNNKKYIFKYSDNKFKYKKKNKKYKYNYIYNRFKKSWTSYLHKEKQWKIKEYFKEQSKSWNQEENIIYTCGQTFKYLVNNYINNMRNKKLKKVRKKWIKIKKKKEKWIRAGKIRRRFRQRLFKIKKNIISIGLNLKESKQYKYQPLPFSYFWEKQIKEIMYHNAFSDNERRKVMSFFYNKLLLFKKFTKFFIFTGKGIKAFYNMDKLFGILKKYIKRSALNLVLFLSNKLFPIYVKGYVKKGKRFHFVAKDPSCNQQYVILCTWFFRSLKGKRYSMYGIHFEDIVDNLLNTGLNKESYALNVENKFYSIIEDNAYLVKRYKKRLSKRVKEQSELQEKEYIKNKGNKLLWNMIFKEDGFDRIFYTWALKRKIFYKKKNEKEKRVLLCVTGNAELY